MTTTPTTHADAPRPWWAATLPLPPDWAPPLPRVVKARLTPRGYVRAANMLAHEFAKEPALRVLAAQVCETVQDIHAEAPLELARWIRANIRYMQEAGEVIQGPFHTLTGRIGDCDDLATLWACLCRSIGIDAVVVGMCAPGTRRPPFVHAVGMAGGRLYELTDDRAYTMGASESQILLRWPAQTWGYYWQPTRNKGRWMGDLASLTGQLEGLGQDFQASGLDSIPLPDVLRKGVAAATSAAAAGSAAASTAATLGLSAAAVPIIGWVVGGAALLGVGIGMLASRVKQKRTVLQLTNQVDRWIDTTIAILEPTPDQVDLVRARLLELIPAMAGVRGERGAEKRRTGTVTIAALADRAPRGGATWIDGTARRRAGLASSVGTKGKAERIARQMRTSARALAEGMMTLAVVDRRRAFNLAVETFLNAPAVFGGVQIARADTRGGAASAQAAPDRLGPIARLDRALLTDAPPIRASSTATRSTGGPPLGLLALGALAVGVLVWHARRD